LENIEDFSFLVFLRNSRVTLYVGYQLFGRFTSLQLRLLQILPLNLFSGMKDLKQLRL